MSASMSRADRNRVRRGIEPRNRLEWPSNEVWPAIQREADRQWRFIKDEMRKDATP